ESPTPPFDSTRDDGGESTASQALATSHSAALARLEQGAVAPTSACTAGGPPSSARDTGHPHGHVGWYGVGHPWCGPAARPRTRAQQVAAAGASLAQVNPEPPVPPRHAVPPR